MMGFPLRLLFSALLVAVVALVPDISAQQGATLPMWTYAAAIAVSVCHRFACNLMFVSQMSFFARVSDPRVGGTCGREEGARAERRLTRCAPRAGAQART